MATLSYQCDRISKAATSDPTAKAFVTCAFFVGVDQT